MNPIYNQSNNNIININKSQSKEKAKNYLSVFSNLTSQQNRYSSENQRNITKFNSQKKIRKKDSHSKNQNHNESKNNAFLVSFNDNINNIKLKNYSNLLSKNNKTTKNSKNTKNKSHCLSKPQLVIEINNINNSGNISTNHTRISGNNRVYKKNISEHDLVNNILNTFTNYNFPKGVNIKLNFSSKKKLSQDKNKTRQRGETMDNKKSKQNKTNNNNGRARHASDTKLLRSSSGYTYSNNTNLAQTNSFFNGNHSNQLGYISTWGNNPEWNNQNMGNILKISNQKPNNNKNKNNNNNNQNNQKSKNNKGPFIGKIIKNYKNNDLNCIFNMNVIPPSVSPINNIQDYFKNLYKIEYSDNRCKKMNNDNKRKENEKNNQKDKDKEVRAKVNHDDYSQSKNTMTKTSDISKIKREKESIDAPKFYSDCPEEIHYYIISSIQNGKNMENNMNQK